MMLILIVHKSLCTSKQSQLADIYRTRDDCVLKVQTYKLLSVVVNFTISKFANPTSIGLTQSYPNSFNSLKLAHIIMLHVLD